MDESTDGTARFIEGIAGRCSREVVLLRQTRERGSADSGRRSSRALRVARAPWVCVMDADLQHPPELIAALLERRSRATSTSSSQAATASNGDDRELRLGARDGLSVAPRTSHGCCSRAACEASRDPMSGFFLVRRDAIDLDALRPRGFKILLELLVRHACASARRGVVRVRRAPRRAQQGDDPRGRCATCRCSRGCVSPASGSSALSGLVVNTVVARVPHRRRRPVLRRLGGHRDPGIHAVELLLHRALGLLGSDHRREAGARRMALFFLMNNAALALRGPLLVAAHVGARHPLRRLERDLPGGPHDGALRARRHLDLGEGAAHAKSQPAARSATTSTGSSRVTSDARLPGAGALPGRRADRRADIRVRLGRVSPRTAGTPPSATARAPVASDSVSSIDIGRCRSRRRPRGCVGRSPHVLYTNVVEPILRWTFAERGYALVHAACLASGERRVPGHGPDRHREDDDEPAAARPPRRTRSSPTT